uniref:Large ribosomal subunit protein uL13 n=1 Tax=Parastrongyloides trichosuri TaxID=131310 RepID=A0A0N4ZYM6_PARTI
MGFSSAPIVIDGKDHLLGRLAALVAKNLLQGQKVVVVRCEDLVISGNFHRSKLKYLSFMNKRCNINPNRGAFHYRAPSKIFQRTVRGMLPHKTTRGMNALRKLTAFEGVPTPYDKMKKMVVPNIVRHVALKPTRDYCQVGRLSHEVGWQYKDIVAKLEAKRKVKAAAFYVQKKLDNKLKAKAVKSTESKVAEYNKVLAEYGF